MVKKTKLSWLRGCLIGMLLTSVGCGSVVDSGGEVLSPDGSEQSTNDAQADAPADTQDEPQAVQVTVAFATGYPTGFEMTIEVDGQSRLCVPGNCAPVEAAPGTVVKFVANCRSVGFCSWAGSTPCTDSTSSHCEFALTEDMSLTPSCNNMLCAATPEEEAPVEPDAPTS